MSSWQRRHGNPVAAVLGLVALTACGPVPSERLATVASVSRSPQITGTTAPPLIPTWTPVPAVSPSSPASPETPYSAPLTITFINMLDTATGWAVGHVEGEGTTLIVRTSDGGDTWLDVTPDQTLREDYFNERALFLDPQSAWVWASDSRELLRTLDAGLTWAWIGSVRGQPQIWFNDTLNGWKMEAEAYGLSFVQFEIISIAITQDGGQAWIDTNMPPGRGSAFMAFPDAQTAWAIRAGLANTLEGMPNLGLPFSIQSTSDAGGTWIARAMPLPPGMSAVTFQGDTRLGNVGNCDFKSPVYSSTSIWKLALTCEGQSWTYTTSNQGETWIIDSMPPGLNADIQFISPMTGWLALGDSLSHSTGHLYQTTNGGESWTLIKRTGWTSVQMDFLDAQTGWAVACSEAWHCDQDEGQFALVKTTDGGRTWAIFSPQVDR